MSDDELVEKVARATCGQWGWDFDDLNESDRDIAITQARAAVAAVDLPAVRAEAERAGAAKALREAARDLPWTYNQASGLPDHAQRLAQWMERRAAEVESGVTAQEARDQAEGLWEQWRDRCSDAEDERDALRAVVAELEWETHPKTGNRRLRGRWHLPEATS